MPTIFRKGVVKTGKKLSLEEHVEVLNHEVGLIKNDVRWLKWIAGIILAILIARMFI